MRTKPYSVLVFAEERIAVGLAASMPRPCVRVRSFEELVLQAKIRHNAVAFVGQAYLSHISPSMVSIPLVAVLAETPRMLSASVDLLAAYPWLAHTLASPLLTLPSATELLDQLLDRLIASGARPVLGASGVGRIAMLADASRRSERFGRMRDFFERHEVSDRTVTSIIEVAEELVMNSLYDAPFEAGYLKTIVPRTENIELPQEHACEISYGIEREQIFVRVRDTFGALTRRRLVEVLGRCNASSVKLDETRGGAGLGLWRIFSAASSVSIRVSPRHVTDILISISTQRGRAAKSLRAVDLSFGPEPANDALDPAMLPSDLDMLDRSVTLLGGTI
ncbi:hypothetical protein BH11MYX1_BH11MYX1_27640 [soil metagenome]